MTDSVALLGVKGGPAIRPGSNMPTSLLVTMGGRRVLVDAGLGAARGVCDQGVALPEIDAIFVTHMHSDHYLELGPLLHTAWTAGLDRAVPVHGPPRLAAYWEGFLQSMQDDIALRIADEGRPDLAALVQLHELQAGASLAIGDLRVTAMENHHPPVRPSFALRCESPFHTVVLSGDTAPIAGMVDFARGADLLVHEAMLPEGVDAVIAKTPNGDDRLKAHILRSHTSAEEAGRIAAEAGVGRLALHHFVPDGLPGFTDEDWTEAVRRTWSGPLLLGHDGLCIPLD